MKRSGVRSVCFALILLWPITTELADAAPPASLAAAQKQCLNAKTPKECQDALPLCRQAHDVLAARPADSGQQRAQAEVLNQWGECEALLGRYVEAENQHRRALALLQSLLGREHPNVADSLNNLAAALANQGKDAQAEEFHRQALGMRQRLLGEQHPLVAESLNNLAAVLGNQGKYPAAEPLHRQALALFEKILGREHVTVLPPPKADRRIAVITTRLGA